jgi:hypothetical protein
VNQYVAHVETVKLFQLRTERIFRLRTLPHPARYVKLFGVMVRGAFSFANRFALIFLCFTFQHLVTNNSERDFYWSLLLRGEVSREMFSYIRCVALYAMHVVQCVVMH